jgi:hypothetical protein
MGNCSASNPGRCSSHAAVDTPFCAFFSFLVPLLCCTELHGAYLAAICFLREWCFVHDAF